MSTKPGNKEEFLTLVASKRDAPYFILLEVDANMFHKKCNLGQHV